MEFTKEYEDPESYYKFEVEFTEDEAQIFKEMALERIKDDDNALINYAVNVLLREAVGLIEEKEEKEDGKSNS